MAKITRKPCPESAKSGNWGFLKKLFHFVIIIGLVWGVGRGYLLWLKYYNSVYPKIVRAKAVEYVEELPLEGVLLWDEEVVEAPRDGVVSYTSLSPKRVAKGDTVAAIDGHPVRVNMAGYFLPAFDGEEGDWTYAKLWQGISLFPSVKSATMESNGIRTNKGKPLGKFVPQPQELRCIAYLDKTLSLEDDVKNGFINIKTEPDGKRQKAVVRTFIDVGQKYKIYVTLPFFTPELLISRAFSCTVVTESRQGISVPISSVLAMDGRHGVLLVKGGVLQFAVVEGHPMDRDSFFVTKGLTAGDVLVLQGDKNNPGDVVIPW